MAAGTQGRRARNGGGGGWGGAVSSQETARIARKHRKLGRGKQATPLRLQGEHGPPHSSPADVSGPGP